jgi:hypothetical protein
MTDQSSAIAKRRGRYHLRSDDGTVMLTVFAPRDGANRVTSAADLTVAFTPAQWARFAADVAFLNAGMGR